MTFYSRLILGMLAILVISGESQAGTTLTQKEILARCYAQLTGKRIPPNDSRIAQLTSSNAPQLCAKILSDVKFDSSGLLEQPSNLEHRAILKQFHDIHRNWFERQFFDQAQFGDGLMGTVDIYEPTQPSFNITKALFSGADYKSVLTGSDYLVAARDPAGLTGLGSPSNFPRLTRVFMGAGDGDGTAPFNEDSVTSQSCWLGCGVEAYRVTPVPLVKVGQLLGIQSSPGPYPVDYLYTDIKLPVNQPGLIMPHNLHKSFGGGALGTQGLLLSTFGHGFDYVSNGTTKLPRRWIVAGLKTFMCRPDGYLRDEDISNYMRSNSDAPTFRAGKSCLKCHSTMDQAAMTARNITPAATGYLSPTQTRLTATMAQFQVSTSPAPDQEFWPSKNASGFNTQAPLGKFYYRTMNGDLLDRQVSSLEELAQVWTSTDDYYACAASRYVEYFTGVKIPIVDPGNPDNAASVNGMTESDKKWKQFVIDLGQKLKKGGTVKDMIASIFASEFYKQSNFGK